MGEVFRTVINIISDVSDEFVDSAHGYWANRSDNASYRYMQIQFR